MGQLCSSLVKGEAQGPSFVSILAQADIQAVHRALEAEPHKVRKHLSGKLGTPLHVAAAHGRTQCVELLMQQALALAVGPGMEDATVVISSEDSSDVVWSMVNSGNNRRQTPLMLAAAAGHEECALLLLERGANRWAADSLGGRTALHYAARANQALLVTVLVVGAPPAPAPVMYPNTASTGYVDVRTLSGFTPLHLAAHAGALEAAAALVQAGATLTGRNLHDGEWLDCVRGATPLHLAACKGNYDMCLLLLAAWAQLPRSTRSADLRTFRDRDNALPHHLAAARGHTALLPLLDPVYPLAAALAGSSSSSVVVALGPPRLARLAADALHAKLAAALEHAATTAAAALEHAASSGGAAAGGAGAAAAAAASKGRMASAAADPTAAAAAAGERNAASASAASAAAGARGGVGKRDAASAGAGAAGASKQTAAFAGAAAAAAGGEVPSKQTEELQQECPVCLEQLGPAYPGVVLAPCCHTMCLSCCQQMHLGSQETCDFTRCPMCRAGVGSISAWP